MAIINPFRAIRPSKEYERIIPALPYDVYNRAEAKEVVDNAPHSFLAIDRPETQFGPDFDMYSKEAYEKASSMLREWLSEGSLIQDDKPCYYIYELIMDGRSQTGIVGCASIDDYCNNIIKKHENTRADKEQDRINHVDTCNAQTGPIFLAYRSNEIINGIVNSAMMNDPIYDFANEDHVTHRVWIIDNDSDIKIINHIFSTMDSIYIADGHHRCASAVKVGLKRRAENPNYTGAEEFNYFLSVLFPDEELMIMDYNRVIKDLNGMSEPELMDKLANVFTIGAPVNTPVRPRYKGEVSMYIGDKWYPLTMKDEVKSEDPVEGLDVAILQKYVLDELFGIKDPKTDKRIDFVGGIRGLGELERRVHTDCKIAFAMCPTSIDELFNVADAGLLMPPKSTWFEPKLRSGIFIHDISK
ncbi:MAG: DUF1015 family protein [Lachnospiraceae bacterium]|nr:DUF1015 family protein [Lachnospiraceae bacterium]